MPEKKLDNWEVWLNQWFLPLLLLGVVVNLSGLFITIIDSDGTLYATIAKTIAQTGDFVNLKVGNVDWLDKPHFPFWMAAISMKLFGINTFAYKLPALLFSALGGYYTYQFAKLVYSITIARLSLLMYVAAAHLFISNNDVRAEPYLTGLLIGSIYYFYIAASAEKWFIPLVKACLLTGAAMMTKGPFILIPIGGGFIAEWVIKKDWKQFYSLKWFLAIALVLLFTLPELYCLYIQFDLHPEKLVFNKRGVSGIRFFFWDSQFGRFFNTGPIQGEGDPLFYLHTMLWAFLPWGLLFYIAIFWKALRAKARDYAFKEEFVSLGGGMLLFLVFSLSKFQLPHYLNILFPFFSIITAQFVVKAARPSLLGIIKWLQYVLIVAMIAVCVLLLCFYRPENNTLAIAIVAITATGCILLFNQQKLMGAIGKSYLAALGVYLFLNGSMYPSLLQYQAGSNAAWYINQNHPNAGAVVNWTANSFSFDYYSKAPSFWGGLDSLRKCASTGSPVFVFTDNVGIDSLRKNGFSTNVPVAFNYFHITEITPDFLYFKTRESALKQLYVVKITAHSVGVR